MMIVTMFFSLATPVFAYQYSLFPCNGANMPNGGKECTFGDLVETAQAVAERVVAFGLIVAPLIFAFAGYLYLTSQDNPGKRTRANGIFKNVAIGLVIMLIAWAIVNLILTALVCGNITSASWFPFSVSGGGSGQGCNQ